jgi:hypothetical protein
MQKCAAASNAYVAGRVICVGCARLILVVVGVWVGVSLSRALQLSPYACLMDRDLSRVGSALQPHVNACQTHLLLSAMQQ